MSVESIFCSAQLGWLQFNCGHSWTGLFVFILPILLPLFFPLQSQKQLKQQQEEKTNKAPVKQRLNQNKFYVSVSMKCCVTDAPMRKNTNICAETRLGRKVSQEVYHGVPSSPQYCSFHQSCQPVPLIIPGPITA